MLSPPAKIPGQEDQDHIGGNLSWHLYGVADNSKYAGSIFTVQFYSRLDHLRTLVGDTFLVWPMVFILLRARSIEAFPHDASNCQTCLTNIIQLTKVWKYKFNLNLHLEQWWTFCRQHCTGAQQPHLAAETENGRRLDATVLELARRMSSVPRNQLMMQKMVTWRHSWERNPWSLASHGWRQNHTWC